MWLEIEMTKRGAFPAELEATIKVEWEIEWSEDQTTWWGNNMGSESPVITQ